MKNIVKTVEATGDVCVRFTDEEMEQLGFKIGQKYSVNVLKNGSIELKPYAEMELDLAEFDRDILEMLIKESCDKDISVNDVIADVLRKMLGINEE